MKKSVKPRMTKAEKKLKDMLNYFEISMDGSLDESASPDKTKKLTDQVRNNYDANTLSDIIAKIRNNMIDRMRQQEDEDDDERDDDVTPDEDTPRDDDELRSLAEAGSVTGDEKHNNVNKFLVWLASKLHSDDHKILVSTDGYGTTQIIIKKNTGGRSRM